MWKWLKLNQNFRAKWLKCCGVKNRNLSNNSLIQGAQKYVPKSCRQKKCRTENLKFFTFFLVSLLSLKPLTLNLTDKLLAAKNNFFFRRRRTIQERERRENGKRPNKLNCRERGSTLTLRKRERRKRLWEGVRSRVTSKKLPNVCKVAQKWFH